jgi:hypothetical protein
VVGPHLGHSARACPNEPDAAGPSGVRVRPAADTADDGDEGIVRQLTELDRQHHRPKPRLKALVRALAARRELVARYGCRYGTLGSELAKQAEGTDPLAALLMRIPLDWAEQQFRAMGRRDAHDLAVELVATYQGSALLSNTLGQPELMARQARRLERWIDELAPSTDPPSGAH